MSGAGKSVALKMLEDMGYFCVDNLPIPFMLKFAQLSFTSSSNIDKIALGIDTRSGQALLELEHVLEQLTISGYHYEILYLDASDEVLVKRFKETRRVHPLADGNRVDKGIERERHILGFLRKNADYIIDTSQLLTRELKRELEKIFIEHGEFKNLMVSVVSFGFKYGTPNDSDLVFDVRFLPNPYYIEELRPLTGNDKKVQDYVHQSSISKEFLDKLEDMLKFLIPNYIIEGKNQLVISIGCTGGKHRSVTLANDIYERLNKSTMYGIRVEHRDMYKDGGKKD